jgi:hypothetical protein
MNTALERPSPNVGFEPPPIEDLEPLFPQFDLIRLIGRGGMGAVYEARDKKLDRPVAIKVLPPALADDLGFVERFTREARAMARLNHPNVVTIHDFGEVEGCCYLVLELVEGQNLRQRMGGLSPTQSADILQQACAGLAFAHARGIVHRDVKPENILLGDDGRVRLADFGLAKAAAEGALHSLLPSLTATRQALGTPHYMAPEQLEGGEVDERADVYAMGVVAYELVTGSLPLGRFPDPSRTKGVDEGWDTLILTALERDASDRHETVEVLRAGFADLATGKAPVKAPVVAPPRQRKSGSTPAPRKALPADQQESQRKQLFGIAITGFLVFLAGFLPWAKVSLSATAAGRMIDTTFGRPNVGNVLGKMYARIHGYDAQLTFGQIELPLWILPLTALLLAGLAAFSRYQRRDLPWRGFLAAASAGLLLTLVFAGQVLGMHGATLQLGPIVTALGGHRGPGLPRHPLAPGSARKHGPRDQTPEPSRAHPGARSRESGRVSRAPSHEPPGQDAPAQQGPRRPRRCRPRRRPRRRRPRRRPRWARVSPTRPSRSAHAPRDQAWRHGRQSDRGDSRRRHGSTHRGRDPALRDAHVARGGA